MTRPSWCLEQSKAFLEAFAYMREESSNWSHQPAAEELLANLLESAYQLGRREGVSEDVKVELEALQAEIVLLRDPFLQLMKRLRPVDLDEDPECPTLLVRCRLSWTLWHQLRNLYEATLPPVDHSWLEECEREDDDAQS
jgi:hypothetical protein